MGLSDPESPLVLFCVILRPFSHCRSYFHPVLVQIDLGRALRCAGYICNCWKRAKESSSDLKLGGPGPVTRLRAHFPQSTLVVSILKITWLWIRAPDGALQSEDVIRSWMSPLSGQSGYICYSIPVWWFLQPETMSRYCMSISMAWAYGMIFGMQNLKWYKGRCVILPFPIYLSSSCKNNFFFG